MGSLKPYMSLRNLTGGRCLIHNRRSGEVCSKSLRSPVRIFKQPASFGPTKLDNEIWKSPDERDFVSEYYKYNTLFNAIFRPFKWVAVKTELYKYSFNIFDECFTRIDENQDFIDLCKFPYKVHPWYAFGMLYLWMYSLRLKSLGQIGKDIYQEVYNFTFTALKMRIYYSKIEVNNSTLFKDLLAQFYGTILALNEGLSLGDKYMIGAVTRNVLSYGYYDFIIADHFINYIYSQLKRLEDTSDFNIIKGHFRFNDIGVPDYYKKYCTSSRMNNP